VRVKSWLANWFVTPVTDNRRSEDQEKDIDGQRLWLTRAPAPPTVRSTAA
jgi:hypothetical protein